MATSSLEQDVVVIRDPAKSKEIRNAMASGKKAFSDVKPSVSELTKEEKEVITKWFSRCEK